MAGPDLSSSERREVLKMFIFQFSKLKDLFLSPLTPSLRDVLGSIRRYPLWGTWGQEKIVVFEVDGSGFHGGLCDRFKGIVSLYAFCKAIHRPFRIHYIFPFDLQDYFLPGVYDWRLRTEELSCNFLNSRLLRIIGDANINRLLKESRTNRQLHVNANRDIVALINERFGTKFSWSSLWSELFIPCDFLQKQMKTYREQIGSEYIGVAFRFQNIFGDYPEYDLQPLSISRQNDLAEWGLSCLSKIQRRENLPLLVTSDSTRFLALMDNRKGIFPLKGKGAHEDTIKGASFATYGKSILDLLMLSKAKKIYSPAIDEMYVSGFPETAAKIGNIPMERILSRW